MIFDRRQLLTAGAGWAGLSLVSGKGQAAPKSPESDPTCVILLGTKGGPPLARFGRSNAATLIRIKGNSYVVDCGYEVSRQLIAAGFSPGNTRSIFIAH